MSDRSDTPQPEIPPEPGTARAVRQGRISGRVFLVLAVSITLATVLLLGIWLFW